MTNRQKGWTERHSIFFRIRGSFIKKSQFLTKREQDLIDQINSLRKELMKFEEASSIFLGFGSTKNISSELQNKIDTITELEKMYL